MKNFIIGTLILLIAIPFFAFNFFSFLNVVGRLLPILMIVGGAFAIYQGNKKRKQLNEKNDTRAPIEQHNTQPAKIEKISTDSCEAIPPIAAQTQTPETVAEEKSSDTPQEPEVQAENPQQEAQMPASPPKPPAEPIATEETAPVETNIPKAEVQFKGNIETLVFHSVTCNFASGKNCSKDFVTKEEAESQGYKPCKICMSEA